MPGRPNIVITRDRDYRADGAAVVTSVDEAVAEGEAAGSDEVCVIGGSEIFRQMLPMADRLYLTEVDLDAARRCLLSRHSIRKHWREKFARESMPRAEGDDAGFILRVLDRVGLGTAELNDGSISCESRCPGHRRGGRRHRRGPRARQSAMFRFSSSRPRTASAGALLPTPQASAISGTRAATGFILPIKNILRQLAEEIGHKFVNWRRSAVMKSFMDGAWRADRIREDFVWRILGEVAQAGRDGRDVAAATFLDRNHPWYPMARHWLGLMFSAEPEEISTRDAGNYNDTGINLPVEDGYGALIAKLAASLPITTRVVARKVTGGASDVAVETDRGKITAKAVIVATPARMLETGRLAIPGMPAEMADAFANVPMGYYEKIAIAFDAKVFEGFELPMPTSSIPWRPTTHPLNFELHPFGRPIAVTHFAGHFARDMEREGEAGMVDFALATLVRAFGSDLRKRVKKAVATHWSSDVFINGAYSCAKPGHGDSRHAFALPDPGNESSSPASMCIPPSKRRRMAPSRRAYRRRRGRSPCWARELRTKEPSPRPESADWTSALHIPIWTPQTMTEVRLDAME